MKSRKTLLIIFICCTVYAAFSCSNTKDVSCRELFEQYKKINIEQFANIAVSTHKMDKAMAEVYADSLLEYLYRIDSNYVKMNDVENREFLKENAPKAMKYCDSIFDKNSENYTETEKLEDIQKLSI